MTANLGTIDRIIRIILGVVLLALPFMSGWAVFDSGLATAVAIIAGLIAIVTSGMRFCPLYRVFGIRTCKM
ncbi:YgaP family membrane protein [Sulfitobacter donghicola]|uniref:Inner membrane protein YgaP-like transmembrane domain-containing protein n=1 Tax=Sulfitobacter donghicola DSW-25 = KCTC 12864 = JCM 14565 TaxID=1300350 RepID=A0A073IZC3_9RHOB|nr:DUF2892 domain-containing protein [Sulfitobacter donghicola]KEJ90772.1 hypothetical protein DSW25_02335 [Sulfitobacter donghicola DSW-25 = KCTC 12864 = JCM 14565]KIN68031.1 hypothetical protein Z948_1755 [Sulfitobacter donghicola DSW-25 = KCTC 12864 = JCM 14565]